jgi:hypothetical protein
MAEKKGHPFAVFSEVGKEPWENPCASKGWQTKETEKLVWSPDLVI